jgi:RNA polymerase sigma-70 factor, ECF subfamily
MLGLRKPAFEKTVRPELAMLYRVAKRLVRNADEAEDMVQQTLIKAYGAWDRFDGRHLRSWLLRILRNEVLMAHRSARDTVAIEEAEEAGTAEPPFWAEVLWRDRAGRVLEAMDELPAIHRELVQLCDIEGLSYDEAALALEIPVGTVRSRLHRARESLRRRLGPGLEEFLEVKR